MHRDLLAVNSELERAIEDISQLLVVMAVLRHDAAFFQQHARHHNLLPDDELPLQQRIEFFERDGVPGNVLQRSGGGGVSDHRAFSA